GVISNKRRGKQFRQRRDTQHERKAHSTILQTRILSVYKKLSYQDIKYYHINMQNIIMPIYKTLSYQYKLLID
ncbi:unnamed protein product, partial [Brugia pahangi]|uniref:Transposase n=1 Tax=Brugia pahangi TaxID=6280 RepID=A0A0N4T9V4_BRUPA